MTRSTRTRFIAFLVLLLGAAAWNCARAGEKPHAIMLSFGDPRPYAARIAAAGAALICQVQRMEQVPLALALHPFLSGHPFRAKWLDRALQHISTHQDVWLTTGGEIASWYYEHYYDQAPR